MWQWLQPNPELVQPLSSSSLELAASLSNNSSEEMNSDVSNQVASTETRESKFKPVSSSSELSKTSSVYEQKFSVQNWPLYVIFTGSIISSDSLSYVEVVWETNYTTNSPSEYISNIHSPTGNFSNWFRMDSFL